MWTSQCCIVASTINYHTVNKKDNTWTEPAVSSGILSIFLPCWTTSLKMYKWGQCSCLRLLAAHKLHRQQMHTVCKSICFHKMKDEQRVSSQTDLLSSPAAASVTSLIGGNGLWWGEDPALLWEFNSITALVKNELKLSLSPRQPPPPLLCSRD